MHPRKRLARLLRLVVFDYLERLHGARATNMWVSELVCHASTWIKMVRVPGQDVFIQSTTPTANEDEYVAEGETLPDLDGLRLWAGPLGDAMRHAINMIRWKNFPSKRNDYVLVAAINQNHPDWAYGRQAHTHKSAFVTFAAPGIRIAVHGDDSRDRWPPGLLLLLLDVRAVAVEPTLRLRVLVDTLSHTGPPDVLVEDSISADNADILRAWSHDESTAPFMGTDTFRAMYGDDEFATLAGRGFLYSRELLTVALRARRPCRGAKFHADGTSRVADELGELMASSEAERASLRVAATRTISPATPAQLAMRLPTPVVVAAEYAVERIMQRVMCACVEATIASIDDVLHRRVDWDGPDPASEMVQLVLEGRGEAPRLEHDDARVVDHVAKAVWLGLAGSDRRISLDDLCDELDALFAQTGATALEHGYAIREDHLTRGCVGALCQYSHEVVGSRQEPGGSMDMSGFVLLAKCSPHTRDLAARPRGLVFNGIAIASVEQGLVLDVPPGILQLQDGGAGV